MTSHPSKPKLRWWHLSLIVHLAVIVVMIVIGATSAIGMKSWEVNSGFREVEFHQSDWRGKFPAEE